MPDKKEDQLKKSLDDLISEVFAEDLSKSIDIAKDSQTTADAAVKEAPGSQKDEARNAGRPQQISDVPQKDEDGKRDGTYDKDITDNENKEDEPDETKQSPSIDQNSKTGHSASASKAPDVAPFKKSLELTEEELQVIEDLRKAKEDAPVKEQEELIKSVISSELEPLKKAFSQVQSRNQELEALVKAMANAPQAPRSVVGIEQLEKGTDPTTLEPKQFSKSEVLDAAESLSKAGKLPVDVVIELENTGTVFNKEYRQAIENELDKNR